MGVERKKKVDNPTTPKTSTTKPSGSTKDPKASGVSTGSNSGSGTGSVSNSGSNTASGSNNGSASAAKGTSSDPVVSGSIESSTIEGAASSGNGQDKTKAETLSEGKAGKTEAAVTSSMSEAEKNSEGEEDPDVDSQGQINPMQQGETDESEDYDLGEVDEPDPVRNRLQLFTPSSMLKWGQFEAKFFQQLYSQTAFFDGEGNTVESSSRSNYYSGIGNIVFGYNNRLNFGVDFWVQSVFIDTAKGSPFRLFSGNRAPWGRTALTALGPKVKWQPFSSMNNFTIQSSFLLPVAKDPEGRNNGRPFLATQNFLWWTQVFYTNNLSSKFQLFAEIDLYWNIDRRFDFGQSGFFATPATVFLSFFPTSKITLYVNNQFWPTLGEGFVSSWWYQAGIGGKYQISKSLDLEISAGKFLAGRGAAGPATTYNLGFRFVKW